MEKLGERTAITVSMEFEFSRTSQHHLVRPPSGDLNPLSRKSAAELSAGQIQPAVFTSKGKQKLTLGNGKKL